MTRQYIGARYVPIFAGEWTDRKSYEPLMIVTSLGNSYTSKTFVPIGANINDERYWALTGNYNAQVEHYRQEVENLSNEVNDLNTSINGKKMIIIGDSYGVHNNIENLFRTTFDDYTIYYSCLSGNGVLSGNTFLTTFNTLVADKTDLDEVTEVILLGDYNDANRLYNNSQTDAEYEEALGLLLNTIGNTCKNAKINLVPCGIHFQDNPRDFNRILAHMPKYMALAIYRYYDASRAFVIPNSENVLQNLSLVNDTLFHPNGTGAAWLVAHIKQGILGGHLNVAFNGTSTFTAEEGFTLTNNLNWYMQDNIAVYTPNNNALEFTFAEPKSFTAGTEYKLGSIKGSILPYADIRISCMTRHANVFYPAVLELTGNGNLNLIIGGSYNNISNMNIYGVTFNVSL